MLLEEIGGKRKYVQKEQSRLRQKNGIISLKQFTDILDRYQREADDTNSREGTLEKNTLYLMLISKDPSART